MVQLDRNGFTEECYFDFSYSPINMEDGQTGGILVICMDTTEKVNSIKKLNSLNNQQLAANEEITAINEELAATNEELTEAQKTLKRNEWFFRSIAVNIPDSLIIVIDKEHRYVMVEGDLMEKLGYKR